MNELTFLCLFSQISVKIVETFIESGEDPSFKVRAEWSMSTEYFGLDMSQWCCYTGFDGVFCEWECLSVFKKDQVGWGAQDCITQWQTYPEGVWHGFVCLSFILFFTVHPLSLSNNSSLCHFMRVYVGNTEVITEDSIREFPQSRLWPHSVTRQLCFCLVVLLRHARVQKSMKVRKEQKKAKSEIKWLTTSKLIYFLFQHFQDGPSRKSYCGMCVQQNGGQTATWVTQIAIK